MMEPRFEQTRALGEAIRVAADVLAEPIEKVRMSRDRIFICAGRECLELSYTYNNAYSQDGSIMPGSGHWSVAIVRRYRENGFAAAVRSLIG